MSAIRSQQELELSAAKVLIQCFSHGGVSVARGAIVISPAKIGKQSQQIDLAHEREESVQRLSFFREFKLQLSQISLEVC